MYYEHQKGIQSEHRVIQLLQSQGWNLLHHRFKTKMAEIDLIFKKQKSIRIIEVKSLSSWDFISYRVGKRQKQRLKNAFLYFQEHYGDEITMELAFVPIDGDVLFIEIENFC